MVQLFFAWRIWKFSGRKLIPVSIAFCSFASAGWWLNLLAVAFFIDPSLILPVGGIVFAAAFAYYPNVQSLATERSARIFASVWLIPWYDMPDSPGCALTLHHLFLTVPLPT